MSGKPKKKIITMAKAIITNILWDTDTEDELKSLPKEVELELQNIDDEYIEDYISNKLSDNYGYCHNGFAYEITDK